MTEPGTSSGNKLRIGIIGSGIGGSSAAYFARQALGSGVEIVVFERDGQIGSRMQERTIGGVRVETGASLIHSSNQYMVEFIDCLNLHRTGEAETEWEKATTFSQVPPFGIWNGRSFPLVAASSGWLTEARMALRYGLTPRTVGRPGKRAIERLIQVYDLQAAGTSFAAPKDLFQALGLYLMTQRRSDDAFRAAGVSDRFVREVANGVSRGNYGQDARMNAFVNLISLATAGFAGGSLFSVREGNNRVCQGLLQLSHSEVRTAQPVRRIEREPRAETASPTRHVLTNDAGRRETFKEFSASTKRRLGLPEFCQDTDTGSGTSTSAALRRERTEGRQCHLARSTTMDGTSRVRTRKVSKCTLHESALLEEVIVRVRHVLVGDDDDLDKGKGTGH